MICLNHGYGLSGSGSNLWTREVVRALCRDGETVHLVCRDRQPEAYDFVGAAYDYDAKGGRTTRFERDVPYEGRCLLHRHHVDLLPVYVKPSPGAVGMIQIPDMDDTAVEAYVGYVEAALLRIIEEQQIEGMHVNHVVLMAQGVHRASEKTGVPFGVMPHGSAIEYVVKHDARMKERAAQTLEAAQRVFTLNIEVRERILDVFGDLPGVQEKMTDVPVGVDTAQFLLIASEDRPAHIAELEATVAGQERGKTSEQSAALRDGLSDDIGREEIERLLSENAEYHRSKPDAGLEAKLDHIDWAGDKVLVFVGRLLAYKGIPTILAAFPEILEQRPGTKLVLAGSGPLREVLEAFVFALAEGHTRLARNIVAWGHALQEDKQDPFATVAAYFHRLEGEGQLTAYFEKAAQLMDTRDVVFTGYLEHDLLSLVQACCDVGIFPSIIAEASPMVVPEAMACGVFPLGTDFAGMGASLAVAATAVPEEAARLMKLRPAPEYTVADVARQVPQVLDVAPRYREAFRRVAEEKYDWRNIARKLARELRGLGG